MERGLIFKFLCAFWIISSYLQCQPLEKNVQALVDLYLIPDDHPIKPALDAIFGYKRVTLNLESLEDAGFMKAKPRTFTHLIVTKHPALPGYVFKLYLDAQRYPQRMPEHYFWILRIQGAEKIREEINIRGLTDRFKVPHKWIYELPEDSSQVADYYYKKNYILVEEDMDIFLNRENKKIWKSNHVGHQILDELYLILKSVGLEDCLKPENIPFSLDGRIAFIDTQSFGSKSLKYKKLKPFLSIENRRHWEKITKE